MTVCIAALADSGDRIIMASDAKVAFGDFSADLAVVKNEPFLGRYALLFSGNDMGCAGAVIRRARKRIYDVAAELSTDDIAEILHEECVAERNRLITAQVLSRHGFTVESFRDTGKDKCTDTVYYDLQARMDAAELSLEFLLCGFDQKSEAHILSIRPDCPPQDHDVVGFWAIGSGAHSALSSLAHAVEHLQMSRHQIGAVNAYHVLAAKFMAESARDVGKGTFLVVFKRPPNSKDKVLLEFLSRGGEGKVREAWKRSGAPKIPEGITDEISALLKPLAAEKSEGHK